MYVVLDGRLQISNGESEVALGKWDSCRIAGGEHRRIVNRTNSPATVLLAMPLSGDERQRGLRSYITGRNL